MKNVVLLIVACIALAFSPAQAQGPDYAVIVNAANPVASISKEDLAKLFLKKTSTWSTGQNAAPVELPPSAKVREAFAREVLGKTLPQVKSYWQQQIFSGRDVPPPEKPTEGDVVAFVRANPNAIGYVTKGVNLGRGVKVVSVAQ